MDLKIDNVSDELNLRARKLKSKFNNTLNNSLNNRLKNNNRRDRKNK